MNNYKLSVVLKPSLFPLLFSVVCWSPYKWTNYKWTFDNLSVSQTNFHTVDKLPYFRQLSMVYNWTDLFIAFPCHEHKTRFLSRNYQIRFLHSRGQNLPEKKSSWTILFFSDPGHTMASFKVLQAKVFHKRY